MIKIDTLSQAQLDAIAAETPSRIRFQKGSKAYYMTKANSDAHYAEKAAYDAAAPSDAEVAARQAEVRNKTQTLLQDVKLEPAADTRLNIHNLDEWCSLAVFVPDSMFPYKVDAYDSKGRYKQYTIATKTKLTELIGQGMLQRAAITQPAESLMLQMGAAASRAELAAIVDDR